MLLYVDVDVRLPFLRMSLTFSFSFFFSFGGGVVVCAVGLSYMGNVRFDPKLCCAFVGRRLFGVHAKLLLLCCVCVRVLLRRGDGLLASAGGSLRVRRPPVIEKLPV